MSVRAWQHSRGYRIYTGACTQIARVKTVACCTSVFSSLVDSHRRLVSSSVRWNQQCLDTLEREIAQTEEASQATLSLLLGMMTKLKEVKEVRRHKREMTYVYICFLSFLAAPDILSFLSVAHRFLFL